LKLEAKDVLPKINSTQAAERAEKSFFSLATLTFYLELIRSRNQTRLACEFGANPFSRSGDISYTKNHAQTDGAKTELSVVHCVR